MENKYMKPITIQACSQLIILSVFAIANTVYAETVQLDKDQFNESFTKNVNISGSVRAGVMYRSSEKNVQPDSLYIDARSEAGKMLCVNMLSVDGQYSAHINYKLKANTNHSYTFQLPTNHHDIVTSYAPGQLAVLAEIKDECDGKGGKIVPASWGKYTPGSIKIYLNSGARTTSLKLYKIKGGSEKIACKPVTYKKNTAYDTECSIDNINNYNLKKTKIIRKNFGNHFSPVQVQIHISKSQ